MNISWLLSSYSFEADKFGGEEENRTPDLCIANAALYQLSYFPMYSEN